MSEISQPETICSQLLLAENESSARKWVTLLQELKKVLDKTDLPEKKVREWKKCSVILHTLIWYLDLKILKCAFIFLTFI